MSTPLEMFVSIPPSLPYTYMYTQHTHQLILHTYICIFAHNLATILLTSNIFSLPFHPRCPLHFPFKHNSLPSPPLKPQTFLFLSKNILNLLSILPPTLHTTTSPTPHTPHHTPHPTHPFTKALYSLSAPPRNWLNMLYASADIDLYGRGKADCCNGCPRFDHS